MDELFIRFLFNCENLIWQVAPSQDHELENHTKFRDYSKYVKKNNAKYYHLCL